MYISTESQSIAETPITPDFSPHGHDGGETLPGSTPHSTLIRGSPKLKRSSCPHLPYYLCILSMAETQLKRQRPSVGDDLDKAVYSCQLCQRTYERQDHLNRHLDSHRNERTFRCSECPRGFNRRYHTLIYANQISQPG